MKWREHHDFGRCFELASGSLRALISPSLGFSLVSMEIAGEQILCASTRKAFVQYRKGLGPLILPWFNKRTSVPDLDYSRYPHVPFLRNLGISDPFQHGVARYLSWDCSPSGESVRGSIDAGTDFLGLKLRDLVGFEFKAAVTYAAVDECLKISFDINGEQGVTSGIHFYYALKHRASATITLPVEGSEKSLLLPLDRGYDTVYTPRRTQRDATYTLETERYRLDTSVRVCGEPAETFDSVVVFSPIGTDFVCIEPISSMNDAQNGKKENRGTIILSASRRVR